MSSVAHTCMIQHSSGSLPMAVASASTTPASARDNLKMVGAYSPTHSQLPYNVTIDMHYAMVNLCLSIVQMGEYVSTQMLVSIVQ